MGYGAGYRFASNILLALSSIAVGATVYAAQPFQLSSTTFKDGTLLPKKVANNQKNVQNPNCVGDNVSPQLSWANAPDGTKSFALVVTDPEALGGSGVVHWLAYGIPASVSSFAEGETSADSDKYVGGKSRFNVGHYSGPCTPPGAPHHYLFVVIATDFDPKELPAGLTLPEFQAKLTGHGLGASALIGLFRNPY